MNIHNKLKGYNKRAASKPYLIVVEAVKNISLKDTVFGKPRLGQLGQMETAPISPTARFFVQYHATFHSNQADKGYFGFYGRTLVSKPKPLQQSATDPTQFDCSTEDFMFFHTSFTENTSCLIIEVVVTKSEGRM